MKTMTRRLGELVVFLVLVALANALLAQCERSPLDRAGADAAWTREHAR